MSRKIKSQNSSVEFDKGATIEPPVDTKEWSYVDWQHYLHFLVMNRFRWKNLPIEIEPWYIEKLLSWDGECLFVYDEEDDKYKILQFSERGDELDIYGNPILYEGYASNGYRKDFDLTNAEVIYDNNMKYPFYRVIMKYAKMLMDNDLIIDIENTKMKRPLIISGSNIQQTTMETLIRDVDDGSIAIIGNNDISDIGVSVFNPDYKFQMLDIASWRQIIINEFLTKVGIDNNGFEKKERQVSDEVTIKNSLITTVRNGSLITRQYAIDRINKKFELNIEVEWIDEEAKEKEVKDKDDKKTGNGVSGKGTDKD